MLLNPTYKNPIMFDLPYIYKDGKIIGYWKPLFDKEINQDSLSISSDCTIMNYITHEDIYISTLDAKRHTAVQNYEILHINLNTNKITRDYGIAYPDKYVVCKQHFDTKLLWVTDDYNEQKISGYKSR